MPVIIIHTPPPYRPHFVPQSRLDELEAIQKKRELRVSDFKSLNEYQWFYFPKETEREFYEWGEPEEVGKYVADKAMRELEPQLRKVLGKAKESQSFGTVVQR